MSNHKNQPFAVRLRFAMAGVMAALRSEHSLRFQSAALVCVIVVLMVFRVEPVWWAIVAIAGSAVLSAELFNTALEHLVDHLHPEIHPRIRIVKDCAAGAVLISSGGALVVACALSLHLFHRV